MKGALIVDAGDGVGALAAVRALGAAGWRVDVASPTRTLASRSRACRRWVMLPATAPNEPAFLEAVASAAPSGTVVFPAGDAEVLALSAARDRLATGAFPYPAHPALQALFDKWDLTEAARRVGLAVPATEAPPSENEGAIRPPSIVKSRQHWGPGRSDLRTEAVRCDDHVAQLAAVRAVRLAGGRPIVQQVVAGDLMSMVLVVWDGQLLGAHQQVASRIQPAQVGSSVRAETVDVDRGLLDRCLALLSTVGYDCGLVQLEFLRPLGGLPHLIDANPRIYGSLALASSAGWNPLDLLGRAALGRPVAGEVLGSAGGRYHWLEADLRGVAELSSSQWGAELRGVWRWSRSSPSSVWATGDPMPGLASVAKIGRNAVRRKTRQTPDE